MVRRSPGHPVRGDGTRDAIRPWTYSRHIAREREIRSKGTTWKERKKEEKSAWWRRRRRRWWCASDCVPIIRPGTYTRSEGESEKEGDTWGSAGNDPPRDDRLHNDPPGIVRKLIADKIERSQDGIKRKPLIARDRSSARSSPGN